MRGQPKPGGGKKISDRPVRAWVRLPVSDLWRFGLGIEAGKDTQEGDRIGSGSELLFFFRGLKRGRIPKYARNDRRQSDRQQPRWPVDRRQNPPDCGRAAMGGTAWRRRAKYSPDLREDRDDQVSAGSGSVDRSYSKDKQGWLPNHKH